MTVNGKLPEDVVRRLKLLKVSLTLAAPADPKESVEVTRIAANLEGVYGKGKYWSGGFSGKVLWHQRSR